MAQTMKVVAEKRTLGGTSNVNRLRRQGLLPGIVYGEGGVQQIQLNNHEFSKAMSQHESEHLIMDLEIAGLGVKKVLLQEVQHHPVTGAMIHVDFHEVSLTKKIRVKVPLRLVGDAVGVTQQGGTLEYIMREIEIECLPLDIVEHVDVDVSALSIGHNISAGQVKLDPAKHTLITNKDMPVAACSAPREEEVAAPVAGEAAAAEPEVIREKKEEGEAAAGEAGKAPAAGGKAAAPAGKAAAPAAGAKEAAPKAAGKEAKK